MLEHQDGQGPKLKDIYGTRTKNSVLKNKSKWANIQDKTNSSKKIPIPDRNSDINNEPTW